MLLREIGVQRMFYDMEWLLCYATEQGYVSLDFDLSNAKHY